MKITFVLPNQEVSGGNRANFELAHALAGMGHDVTVAYPIIPGRDGQPWWNIRKTLVLLVKSVRNLIYSKPWFEGSFKFQSVSHFSPGTLSRHLSATDLLVVTWWAHALMLAKLQPGVRKAVHLIRSLEFWGGPERLVTDAYQVNMPRLVTSERLRSQFYGRYNEMLEIVPDGVAGEFFRPRRRRQSKTPVTLGMVYRRQPLKRIGDGLQAMIQVARTHPDIEVVVFGDKLKLRDRVLLNQLPRWQHHHFPVGEKLIRLYTKVDIFLFPSGPEEAFGLPPMEAMATGCAVVSTDVGAVSTYAEDGQSVLLCDVSDIGQMARSINKLVEDYDLANEMGIKARLRVQEFTWQKSAHLFMQCVEHHEIPIDSTANN